MGLFDFFNNKPKKKAESVDGIYDFPYFGELKVDNLKGKYETHIEIHRNYVELKLNFEKKSIDNDGIEEIERFLDDVKTYDRNNLYHLENKIDNKSGEAFDFVEYCLENLDDDDLSQIIDLEDYDSSKKQQFFKKIKLVRVWLYPDGKYETEYFATFDYTILIDGDPYRQYLSVYTDPYGKIEDLTWHS